MSSWASKKASSLVVATSMAAVEALKDQAGLCRWDYALRSLYRRAKVAVPASLSSPTSLAANNGATTGASAAARARPRPRRSSEEEKLQKAHHLVCWGPN